MTDAANGRSFDETFAESYRIVPIRKATEEQRRLWLMGQKACNLNSRNGSITFQKNVYHSDWMSQHPGRSVIARFDPENLHEGLSVYDADGSYLGFAECQQKVGFFDIASAAKLARRKARIQKAERDLAKAHAPLSPAEVGKAYDGLTSAPAADLEARVVKGKFGRPGVKPVHARPVHTPAIDPEIEAERDAMVLRLPERVEREATGNPSTDRFFKALDLLARSDAGLKIGAEEANWVREYIKSAEYEGHLAMFRTHGRDGVV